MSVNIWILPIVGQACGGHFITCGACLLCAVARLRPRTVTVETVTLLADMERNERKSNIMSRRETAIAPSLEACDFRTLCRKQLFQRVLPHIFVVHFILATWGTITLLRDRDPAGTTHFVETRVHVELFGLVCHLACHLSLAACVGTSARHQNRNHERSRTSKDHGTHLAHSSLVLGLAWRAWHNRGGDCLSLKLRSEFQARCREQGVPCSGGLRTGVTRKETRACSGSLEVLRNLSPQNQSTHNNRKHPILRTTKNPDRTTSS